MSFCLLCCWCCCYCFFFFVVTLVNCGRQEECFDHISSEPYAKQTQSTALEQKRLHPASYPDVSLYNVRAKEGGKETTGCRLYPSHGPLRFITSQSFRACLCHAKNEAPEEEAGLDLRSLSPALPNLRSGNFYYYYYYYYYSCRLTVLLFSNFGARCFREIYHENHV